MTDLEKFIDTYNQFGVEIKTYTIGDEIVVTLNGFDEDSTNSNKFDGNGWCVSSLYFTKEGKFIEQRFYE